MESFYKLVKIEDVNYADPLGMRAIHYVVRLYPDRLLIDMIRTLKVKIFRNFQKSRADPVLIRPEITVINLTIGLG